METITVKEILSTKVTLLNKENGYDKIGENLPLSAAIYHLPNQLKQRLIDVVNMEYHSEEQKQAKRNIPRYYISGKFELDDWKNGGRFPIHDTPAIGSNLMTIDIDGKDNEHLNMWEIREKIFNLPYVFSCLKSVSGNGFYCIIPIEYTLHTKEYYNYILDLWKQQFNINIDKNAASLIRARIISYEEDFNRWVKNGEVQIWQLRKIKKEEVIEKQQELFFPKYQTKKDNDLNWELITHKAMELLINDGYHIDGYNTWYYLGCELKNFPDGEDLFIKASRNGRYDDSISTISRKFKSCKPSGLTDDVIKKWCGMAKNKYGPKWFVKFLS
jgi:hypothetical protein